MDFQLSSPRRCTHIPPTATIGARYGQSVFRKGSVESRTSSPDGCSSSSGGVLCPVARGCAASRNKHLVVVGGQPASPHVRLDLHANKHLVVIAAQPACPHVGLDLHY